MLHIRHPLLISVVFLSACSFQTKKPDPAAKAASSPTAQAPLLQPQPLQASEALVSLTDTDQSALAASSDLWGRMRKGFSLPPLPSNKLHDGLSVYGRYPSFMNGVSQRGSRYMFYVVDELEKRNMPLEIALIPVIESAYNPKARSPSGPAGLWQMMGGTGKVLGLKQTANYDGRFDVVASTDAAINYMQRLGNKYNGDWYLALAAYNCGEMYVTKAVAANRAKGLPIDFWSLNLPAHTKTYIPKILAIREIINNPAKYKVDLYPIPNRPYFAKVNVGSAISLSAAASVSGVDVKDLQALNPALERAATDPLATKSLLVPASSAVSFASAINGLADKSVLNPKTALGSKNEPLGQAAQIGQVAQVGQAPKAGQVGASTKPKAEPGGQITHELKKGESLWTLSRRYKVSMEQIAQWNNLKPKQNMNPGKQLIIWPR